MRKNLVTISHQMSGVLHCNNRDKNLNAQVKSIKFELLSFTLLIAMLDKRVNGNASSLRMYHASFFALKPPFAPVHDEGSGRSSLFRNI